ncbi:MAG: hypothetical protein KQI81_12355 [Deltaproteobacteria bacterium]|nr:hypothetical protein [Deltaproteobacteria bacterium]
MPEGYRSYKLECGHTHVWCKQRKTDECGMACCGMIIAMKKGKYTALSTLRQQSQMLGGLYYKPSTEDARAPVNDPRYAAMAAIFMRNKQSEAGTGGSNVAKLLKHSYGLDTSYRYDRDEAPGKIRQAVAAGKMLIAGVSWPTGGGHFIVVHNSYKGKYCILDPGADDMGLIRTTNVGSSRYYPPGGGYGIFDEWIVVNG